jgi:nucleoside-diphosphate-sugar epimerase
VLVGVDGYIGTALVQRLLMRGHTVVGVDNLLRRSIVENSMSSKSAIDILSVEERTAAFKKLGGYSFKYFDVSKNPILVDSLISTKPDVVLHLGHQPSAPFSMINRESANKTLMNNIIGTSNILWAIKNYSPDTHYITIGSTGEYDHYGNIDIEEGYITIDHNGRKSNEMIFPRRPGSIYHTSKVSATYLIDFAARAWGLRCTDIQQSVVFGAYSDEIYDTGIQTRFDFNEATGTVINRFIVQAATGNPLTIYGDGEHKRGFISLNDSVQAIAIAVDNPASSGKVQVWNQLSEWHSINSIASMVRKIKDTGVINIPTPRNESTKDHYYNYVTDILKSFGYRPTRLIWQEIKYCIDLLSDCNIVSDFTPEIRWK